jgi:hypothetical protein
VRLSRSCPATSGAGGPGEPALTGPSKPSSRVMGAGMICRSSAPVIASGGGGWWWLTCCRTRLGPARRTGRRCRWGRRLSRYELKANSAVLHYLAPWRVTSTAHPQSLHHAAHNNQSCVPLPVVFSVAISAHNGGSARAYLVDLSRRQRSSHHGRRRHDSDRVLDIYAVAQLDPAAAEVTEPVGHGRIVLMNARFCGLGGLAYEALAT